MRSKLIVIVTQSHLSRNPRVLKEALALHEAGYRVHILASIFDKSLLSEDKKLISGTSIFFEPVSDLSVKNLRSFTERAWNKVGKFLIQNFGFEIASSLGYGMPRYLSRCKQLNADLYICHQELATVIGSRLLEKGFKVGFDLEDWYSEDLLPPANQGRAIATLKKTERYALNNGTFCICTSKVMALFLQQTYRAATPPIPIYNAFDPVQAQLKKDDDRILQLVWFSQTVGKNRGIEEFIKGMNRSTRPYHLTLIGNCSEQYREELLNHIAPPHRLIFHPTVSADTLMERLSRYDIGLAIELPVPLNRNLTISNKLFQYIGSGLPVIASKTLGQDEIMDRYDCGWKIVLDDPESITAVLNKLDARRIVHKQQSVIAVGKELNWANEKAQLLDKVKQVFS